jgi:hypothetical protein
MGNDLMEGLTDCIACDAIEQGICVMLDDNQIVYAGAILTSPDPGGKTVLLHPDDFMRLQNDVMKHRH